MPLFQRLVLFDIDGTLIRTTTTSIDIWKQRLQSVFADIFRPLPPFETKFVDGKLERHYFREFASSLGFSDVEFNQLYPLAKEKFNSQFQQMVRDNEIHFYRIEEAFRLVTKLQSQSNIFLGLITGNNEHTAWLKLRVVDFATPFSVGAFGDEKDFREELVLLAIQKASIYFRHHYKPSDVIVVGDTIHDIRAAKHVGAKAIGVATGVTDNVKTLYEAGADIAVSSLLDGEVIRFFNI